jgi:hypothetical protein
MHYQGQTMVSGPSSHNTSASQARAQRANVPTSPEVDATQLAADEVVRFTQTGHMHDESLQWLFKEVFDDLHGYFAQRNAEKYVDPLSGRTWVTTPALPLTIGDQTMRAVAAVPAGSNPTSPIRFFINRCDALTLGTLRMSDSLYTSDLSEMIEVVDAKNPGNADFSKVTAHELHAFTDELTQHLLNNPSLSPAQRAKEAVGSKLEGFPRVFNTLADLAAEGYEMAMPIVVTAGVFGVAGLGIYGIKEASDDYSDFDARSLHLPAESAVVVESVPVLDGTKVQVLSDEEIDKLVGAPQIQYLDAQELVDRDLESRYEDTIEEPVDTVGRVRTMPIPEEGTCYTTQTFNIPNGTARMVQSEGAPQLIVTVKTHDSFYEEYSNATGGERQLEKTDDNEAKVLTAATVCNDSSVQESDFVPGDNQHLFIEFVRDAPPR